MNDADKSETHSRNEFYPYIFSWHRRQVQDYYHLSSGMLSIVQLNPFAKTKKIKKNYFTNELKRYHKIHKNSQKLNFSRAQVGHRN